MWKLIKEKYRFFKGIFTKCGGERREAIVSDYRRRFVATCNMDGTFTSIQCWKFVGVCWCVNLEGNEIDGTRAINRKPRCPRRDAVLAGLLLLFYYGLKGIICLQALILSA